MTLSWFFFLPSSNTTVRNTTKDNPAISTTSTLYSQLRALLATGCRIDQEGASGNTHGSQTAS